MKTKQKMNQAIEQVVLRDIPAGMPVKTRIRAGLKIKL